MNIKATVIGRRRAVLRLFYRVLVPIGIAGFLIEPRIVSERREDSFNRLVATFPTLLAQGKLKPQYRNDNLTWATPQGVNNQVRFDDRHQIDVITDVSNYTYQVQSRAVPTEGLDWCAVVFSIEVLRGGVSILVLNDHGTSLYSRNLDSPGELQDRVILDASGKKNLQMVVANNRPIAERSEFRVLKFDVYFPPAD